MNKNAVLTTALISVLMFSALVGVQFVSLATANPYWPPPFYPETPNKDLPIITVQSPTNTTYYVNEIPLNFLVTKRDSWFQNNMTLVVIQRIDYQLDGKVVNLWSTQTAPHPPTLPTTKQLSTILNVSRGQHVLQINVTATSFYDPFQSTDWHLPFSIQIVASKTIIFTVDAGDGVPEFQSWTLILLIFTGMAVASTIYRRKLLNPN